MKTKISKFKNREIRETENFHLYLWDEGPCTSPSSIPPAQESDSFILQILIFLASLQFQQAGLLLSFLLLFAHYL